ncbi:hypothetical protein BK128_18065 [Viridibacillus sp. FSL H7-0596]|uniref:hypothetical protein n=1 Tax=Viridibacillus sp. FSL H7-0596 TaxID=1928923 RepID=UPI00096D5262|nr:hypothetical protein [Viridibacillus sp. FSL H7-0596]OMC83615.1 hypothetical protein BK128_18065 [Viridibacillus sp. FSL H7-0596]
MNITLKESKIQFKNPVIGQPTRAVEEHYYARRIVALVDSKEKQFRFMASELPFAATEEDMMIAIELQLNKEQQINAE